MMKYINPRFISHYIALPTDGQTDRQTDRPLYLVCNNSPHLRT